MNAEKLDHACLFADRAHDMSTSTDSSFLERRMDAPAAPLYDDFIMDLDDDTMDDEPMEEDVLDLGFLDRNLSPVSVRARCSQGMVQCSLQC